MAKTVVAFGRHGETTWEETKGVFHSPDLVDPMGQKIKETAQSIIGMVSEEDWVIAWTGSPRMRSQGTRHSLQQLVGSAAEHSFPTFGVVQSWFDGIQILDANGRVVHTCEQPLHHECLSTAHAHMNANPGEHQSMGRWFAGESVPHLEDYDHLLRRCAHGLLHTLNYAQSDQRDHERHLLAVVIAHGETMDFLLRIATNNTEGSIFNTYADFAELMFLEVDGETLIPSMPTRQRELEHIPISTIYEIAENGFAFFE